MDFAFTILLTLLFLHSEASSYHKLSFINKFSNNCTGRSTKCLELHSNSSCLGVPLKYSHTSLAMTDLDCLEKANETIQTYAPLLKYIPVCWEVIQPFLCALYFPKCTKDETKSFTVEMPSREMCNLAMHHCRPIQNRTEFLHFINCSAFPVSVNKSANEPIVCKNYFVEERKKFNTTSFCMDPLMKTDKRDDWFNGTFIGRIEGCGLRCKDALYTETEQNLIHKLITYCVTVAMVVISYTVFTFFIDWRSAKYPTKVLVYINICFVISYVGWLVQFFGSDTRDDVVCKRDGTLRKFEPSATENISCVIVFFINYYFLIAALMWFIVFSYAWYMNTLQALGKVTERVDKKHAYFHLFAWSLPVVLTITTMAISEIDGDYVTGICFVGFVHTAARAWLFLMPVILTMIVSCCFIVKGLILLMKVKNDAKEIMPERANRKIQGNILRMGMVMFFYVVFWAFRVWYHIYYAGNKDLWFLSLEQFISCKLTTFGDDYSRCKQEERPSVAMLQLEILSVFGTGIATACCFWRLKANIQTWRRFIAKKFYGNQEEEKTKIDKSKTIAHLWPKRHKFREGDEIRISQIYTDPAGLRIDMNDAEASSSNSSFIRFFPRLMIRRDALAKDQLYPSESSNQNQSYDSEISLNVRQVSIESRRNSQDSQLSVQIAELKATRKINSRRHNRRYNKKSTGASRRGSFSRRGGSKHGSNTSLDSLMKMLTLKQTQNRFAGPNLNRRTGNAGLDGAKISDLLNNGKLALPSGFKSASEDENMSVTYSESTFSMRQKNHLDFNDQFDVKQLTQGLCLRNMSTSEESDREEKYLCKSGRDSYSSKKSRKSKKSSRKRYSSASADESKHQKHQNQCESSECEEIQQLVHSSLNSNCSVGVEKNRGSRQSKNSTDVAVQANAYDLDLEMQTNDHEKPKSKHAKTIENKKYKRQSKNNDENKISSEKIKKSKEKYIHDGSYDEKKSIRKSFTKTCSDSDGESLLDKKSKISIM